MNTLTVGELKANFSDVVSQILAGDSVAFSYGKKKEPIGMVVPFRDLKKKNKVKLGIWKGKAEIKFSKDFKMSDEEFLAS